MLTNAASGARVSQTKIDELKLDSVIRRIDPTTGSTNYSFFIEENRPYSLTNLVVTENEGAYLAFFAEYISANPKQGWDLQNFHGKVKLTSIDGKEERQILLKPQRSGSGRVDYCWSHVETIIKQIAEYTATYTETVVDCFSFSSSGYIDEEQFEIILQHNTRENIRSDMTK